MTDKRPLEGLRVVITGKLASMRRDEASQLVQRAGGRTFGSVSRQTDLVVVGLEGWPVLRDGTISRKLQTAEQLRQQGLPLEIISERSFLERLGVRRPSGRVAGTCTPAHAARILGVEERQLQRWEQFGLVQRDAHGQLAYRDLVSLRQIAALLGQGVPLPRLSRTFEHLRQLLQVDQPLSQVRVLEQHGELLAELEGTRFDASGQLKLFGNAGPSQPSDDAGAWFDYGADCEEEGRWLDAEAAYRRVIQLDPGFSEAHFNLGNIYRGRGQLTNAAEAYRRAADSGDAETAALALYNLGYVLDELGCYTEAAEALQQCLRRDPGYADAYFNLAMCYERLQQTPRAIAAWREYLQRDADSDWARVARRHLYVAERTLRPPPSDR